MKLFSKIPTNTAPGASTAQASPKRLPKLAMVLLSVAALTACVSTPSKPDTGHLVWPAPPEQPRLKFVAQYSGERDLREASFKDRLLGEEKAAKALQKPYGVAATDDGQRIYVTDTKARRLMVFDLKAKTFAPFRTDAMGGLVSPIEVRLDSRNRVYVTDSVHRRVNIYTPQGKTLLSLGKNENFERPTGLALDESRNRFYVADTGKHRIAVFDLDGQFLQHIGERGSGPGQFNYPVNLAVDRQGRLFAVDSGNFRVQIFSAEGNYLHEFGEAGDGFGAMARPKGLALDSEGHVYLADAAFNNVQVFDEEGQILLFFGSLGHGPGHFWIPTGVYSDPSDRIYVVDSLNARVQVFQYLRQNGSDGNDKRSAANKPKP